MIPLPEISYFALLNPPYNVPQRVSIFLFIDLFTLIFKSKAFTQIQQGIVIQVSKSVHGHYLLVISGRTLSRVPSGNGFHLRPLTNVLFLCT